MVYTEKNKKELSVLVKVVQKEGVLLENFAGEYPSKKNYRCHRAFISPYRLHIPFR